MLQMSDFMAELITYDDDALEELSQDSEDAASFYHALYELNQVSVALSKTRTLDELYEQAVRLALAKLGFERLGILLIENNRMQGTWGVDLEGNVRCEMDESAELEDDIAEAIQQISSKGKVCVWHKRELKEFGRSEHLDNVGQGWNAAIAFWQDDEVIGWVACDNLISKTPFKAYQSHVLRLFGTLLGELILRKRAEESIAAMNVVLEDKVQQRTHELLIAQKQLEQANLSLEEKVMQRTAALQQEKEKLRATLDELIDTQTSLQDSKQQQAFLSRDLLSLKEMQKEISEAKLKAEAADTAKSEFLSNVSHELKTPMNAIQGNTWLLSETKLNQQQSMFLERVQTASGKLMTVIDGILSFSKITAKASEPQISQFALDQLIDEVIDPFKFEASEKGLAFSCYIHADVPFYLVNDADKIKSVLTQLLANAFKFTHQGQIDIVFHCFAADDDVKTLQIQVKDTGIGIEQEQFSQLFQSFTQLDGSAQRKYGGTGLGLALCQHLVSQLGGEIKVDSEVAKGSCFTVTLPSTVVEQDIEDATGLNCILLTTNKTLAQVCLRLPTTVHHCINVAEVKDSLAPEQENILLLDSAFVDAELDAWLLQSPCKVLPLLRQQSQLHVEPHGVLLPASTASIAAKISWLQVNDVETSKKPAVSAEVMTELSDDEINHIMNELEITIEDFQTGAEDLLVPLLAHFELTGQTSALASGNEIKAAIEDYDFDEAMELLNQLKQALL